MRKLALLLSVMAALVLLAMPGLAEDEHAASAQRARGQRAQPDAAVLVRSAALQEMTSVFQEGVLPGTSYDGATDTYIFNERPLENWGQNPYLRLYNDGRQKTLIRFGLSEHIPARAQVSSARLELHTYQRETGAQTEVGLFPVYRSWDEDAASWNRARPGEEWAQAGCESPADRALAHIASATLAFGNSWYSWESQQLTDLVQSWVSDPSANHGVILIGMSPFDRQTWTLFSSQFGDLAETLKRPKLTVTYYVPPASVTPTPSNTPSPTPTSTHTPTITASPTCTPTPTGTLSPTPTEVQTEGWISGMAWRDMNRNGIRDPGELPMAGVPIVLEKYATNEQVGRRVTAPDGGFSFTVHEADYYLLTKESYPGFGCSHPPGETWVFPLALGQLLDRRDFGLYPLATVTATEVGAPTSTPTETPTPTTDLTSSPVHTATGTGTPSVTLTVTSGPTAQPTTTRTPTGTSTSTSTATVGPSPTPTATRAGSLTDPVPVACDGSFAGDTTDYPNWIQDYGQCLGGLSGGEVVYELPVTYPLSFLSISLDTEADLFLLVLSNPDANGCESWGRIIGMSDVGAGTYYLVVDGFESGAYQADIVCVPSSQITPTATPTDTTPPRPTYTSTPTLPTTATQTTTHTPGPSPTPTKTRTPSGPSVVFLPVTRRRYPIQFLVNCGSDQVYTGVSGGIWSADQAYASPNWGYVGTTATFGTEQEIGNTSDPELYRQQRFAYGSFGYQFDVPDGDYQVTLHFSELWWAAPGKRSFDVSIEGRIVLDDYDVFAAAGGRFRAQLEDHHTTVNDGQLNITLIRGSADFPIINALSVTKE